MIEAWLLSYVVNYLELSVSIFMLSNSVLIIRTRLSSYKNGKRTSKAIEAMKSHFIEFS